ncbi:MAG: hypothetical protein JWO78_440 [Micavibrio sp.]|nr:hypothetical protein [Micavibrio sp.]
MTFTSFRVFLIFCESLSVRHDFLFLSCRGAADLNHGGFPALHHRGQGSGQGSSKARGSCGYWRILTIQATGAFRGREGGYAYPWLYHSLREGQIRQRSGARRLCRCGTFSAAGMHPRTGCQKTGLLSRKLFLFCSGDNKTGRLRKRLPLVGSLFEFKV